MFEFVMRAALLLSFLALVGCGSSSSDGSIRYVALGASDAAGVGAIPPSDGYVFRLHRHLNADCVPTKLTNLAIPGAQLDAVISIQLPIVKQTGADLVTLWPGPNDLIRGTSTIEFEKDLQVIVDALLETSNAEIFLGNIPDLTRIPRFQENPDPDVTTNRINEFNRVILKMTLNPRVRLVNLAAVGADPTLVSDIDGFHPNEVGHSLIANLFEEEIRSVFCR